MVVPSNTEISKLVVATRLHLGNASTPPSSESLQATIRHLVEFCTSHPSPSGLMIRQAVIAVDATPKFPNYDLVQAVQQACDQALKLSKSDSTTIAETNQQRRNEADDDISSSSTPSISNLLHVLPVTPWGMFVPALNALLVHAMSSTVAADFILFVSAESCSSSEGVLSSLWQHMDPSTTLVCGAVLPGHEYIPPIAQESTTSTSHDNIAGGDIPQDRTMRGIQHELTGRTTPWNTMALWNLSKLALTGFLLISDGVIDSQAYGVEEVVAIATLQSRLGPDQAMAKLISVSGVEWDQDFGADEQRRHWHEQKMKSKFTRAQRQLDLLKLKGWVHHY